MMHWSLVLIFSIMGCEIIFCITLNLLFTVIILKSKTLRKSFTNIIFALMFVAHFLTNVCNIGKFCARFLTDTRYIDVISNSRDFFSGLVVGFSTLLSLVTFLSIYKPFVYEKFTTKHAVVAITTIFLIMIWFTVWRVYSLAAYFVAISISNVAGVVIMICNILLYRSVKRQCNDIASTIVTLDRQKQNQQRNQTKKRSLKSLKMCILISASYFITILSGIILLLVRKIYFPDRYEEDFTAIVKNPDSIVFLYSTSAIIGVSNGIWDVFIFYKFNSEAKRKFRNVFGIFRGHNKVGVFSSTFRKTLSL